MRKKDETRKKRKQKYSSVKHALEPRMVFDASLAATTPMHVDTPDASHPADTSAHLADKPQAETLRETELNRTTTSSTSLTETNIPLNTFANFSSPAKELIFIDTRVQDPQALLVGLSSTADVYFLNANQDGIMQMDAIIKNYGNQISGISILSHGEDAAIQLGSATLNEHNLMTKYADEIASWKSYLKSDADISLFGCSVAADASGKQFVSDLSKIVGVGVAASDNLTGNANLGGDWNLEFESGVTSLSSTYIFNHEALSNYKYLLANPVVDLNGPTDLTVSDNFSSGTYTGGSSNLPTTWSGGWQEFDASYNRAFQPAGSSNSDNLPTGGNVVIASVATGGTVAGLGTGNELAIIGHPVQFGDSIDRQINLQAYTTATLNFTYRTAGLSAADAIEVDVSTNGGANYFTLGKLANTTSTTSINFDISNYIADKTTIEFRVSKGFNTSSAQQFFLDNVAITASGNNYVTNFSEQTATPVNIVDPAMTISAPGQLIKSAQISLSNMKSSDQFALGTLPSTIIGIVNNTNGTVTLTSVAADGASTADFTAALKAITFANSSALLNANERAINISVTDANNLTSQVATTYVGITPYDQAMVTNSHAIIATPIGTTAGRVFDSSSLTAERNIGTVYDYDRDTLGLSAALLSQATKGTAVVNSDGTYTYTPNAGATGADSFTYSLTSQAQVIGTNYQEWNTAISSLKTGFPTTAPDKTGFINGYNVNTVVKGSSNPNGLDNFVIRFTNTVTINTAGTYTFYAGSDDGSILYIDGQAVVDNDTPHPFVEKNGTITLSAGIHTLQVDYFQNLGQEVLNVSYLGPDTSGLKTDLGQVGAVLANTTTTGTVNVTILDSGPRLALGTDVYALDNFTTAVYSRNDGTFNWSGNWVEANETTNPIAGQIQIVNTGTNGALQVQDLGGTGVQSISRSVDMLGLSSATPTRVATQLSFDYDVTSANTNGVNVQISINNGSTWTTLDTLSSATGTRGTKTYDISNFATSNALIRFLPTVSSNTSPVFIDNVKIDASQVNFTAATYLEDGSGIAIASPTTRIATPTGSNLSSATITITNAQAGDTLYYDNSIAGISASLQNNILTLSGINSSAQYALALQHVFFKSVAESPATVARSVAVTVNDVANNFSNTANTIINVVDVNDAPVGIARSVSMSLNNAYIMQTSDFAFTDADNNSLQAVKLTTIPTTVGALQYDTTGLGNWVSATTSQIISASDIASGRLRFAPASGVSGVVNFNFQIQDNGGVANGGIDTDSVAKGFSLNVLPGPNTPPTLLRDLILAPNAEDNSAPTSRTISQLMTDGGTNAFYDPDPSAVLRGLAIVSNSANAATQGVWQYSTNNVNWINVGTVGDNANTQALVLSAATQLRFVPVANYNGTPPGLSVRAIDDTYSGNYTNGNTKIFINSGNNGGSTPIADIARNITTTVTPVNDAPDLIPNSPTLHPFSAGAINPAGQLVSDFIQSSANGNWSQVTDVDAGAVQGIAIISAGGSQGTWQYSTDSGSTWNFIGSVTVNSALLLRSTDLIRFTPSGTNMGSGALTYRAWDQTTGSVGAKVDTANNGGTTAFSVLTDVVSISLSSANAPNLTSSLGAVSYIDRSAPTIINSNLILTDTGATHASTGQVSIGNNFAASGDSLSFTNNPATMGNITAAYNSSTGILTLSSSGSTATIAQWQAALRAVKFSTTVDITTGDSRTINYQVTDTAGLPSSVFQSSLNLIGINDAPIGMSASFALTRNSNYIFSINDFGFSDASDFPVNNFQAVQITSLPAAGSLTLNGSSVALNSLVLVSDINAGKLIYNTGNSTTTSTFQFKVQDDGGTANGGSNLDLSAKTFTFNISGTNHAPTLINLSPILNPISELDINNPGQKVSDLLSSSDVDLNSLTGVAITSIPTANNGLWQYSLDGGSTWVNIPAVSSTSSLLLRNTDLVRFLPTTHNAGGGSFTFKAWDQTSGNVGTLVSTVTSGGSTAFSTLTGTASIVESGINEAPLLSVVATNPTFSEVGGFGPQAIPVNIFSNANVDTVETGQAIVKLAFTVSNVADGAHESIVVDGRTITFGANSFGTTLTNNLSYISTITNGTATITLSSASGLTPAAIDTVLNNLTYRNTSLNGPTQGSRAFTITTLQDNGGIANGGIDTSHPLAACIVNVLNDVPTITSGQIISVSEGISPTVGIYTATATNSAHTPITYSLSGPDAASFSIDPNSGVIKFVAIPNATVKPIYNFNLVAAGQSTHTSIQAMTVNVTDVAPVITSSASITIPEGTSITTPIYTAVASDVVGSTLRYSITGTDASAFNIDAVTGVLTFKAIPNATIKSTYSISVAATDGQLVSSLVPVTVNVTDVAPVITSSASITIPEGTSITTPIYTAVANDVVGSTLRYSLSGTDAAAFNIDAVTGVLTFKAIPNATIKSTYSISVAATDGQLVSSLVPVTVNVTDVAPVITSSASITIPEGTSITTPIYTAVANDVGGSTLRYSLSGTDAAAFNIDAVTGVLTFKAVPNATVKSIYNINVAATDGQLVSSLVPVTVNVTDVAPVITSSASITIPEGTAITTPIYTAVANDVVGSTLRYSLSGTDAAAFNIDAVTGVLTFKTVPNATIKSIYNINVAATDGQLVSSLVPVTVNVTDVAPVITSSASITIPEGTSITTPIYTAVANDVVGSTLRYSITGTDAAAFNIDAVTGVLTFKAVPNATVKSIYNISVAATDGQLVSSLVPVTVNVTDVAPVITSSASITIPEGTSITTPIYTAVANDVVGSTLRYSLSGTDAAAFNIDAVTGVLTFKAIPNATVKSTYSISVAATDGQLVSSLVPVTVNVTDVAPVITSSASITIPEGTSITTPIYTAVASDVVGSTLRYSITGTDASAFNIDAVTGVLTFKTVPNATIKSIYNISVAATDGQLVSSLVPVTVNVTDVAPVITSSASITIPEGTSITTPIYTAVANDVVGSTLRYSLSGTDAAAFNIDAVTGVLTFKAIPNATIKSTYSISVAATDGQLVSSLVPVTVNVTDVAPVITSSASITIAEGTSITTPIYTAVANDVGGSTLRYSLSGTDAAAFNIDAVTGVLTFKAVPNATVKSIYNINVAATDGQLVSSLVPVTVNVTDVAPVITSSASITIPEGTAITTPIYTAVANDVVGSTLRYSITGTDASAFNIDAVTGALTFKTVPNATIKSIYNISVAATDGQLVSSLVPVTVNVTDVAPVITSSASITIPEGTAITTPIYTAVANDVVGSTLRYSLSGTDASAFNIDAVTGVLTFKAVPNATIKSTYSISVAATDGQLVSSLVPVTVNVTDVAPVITSSASITIPEGTAITTPIYTAVANDVVGSTLRYSLSGTDAAAFNIDAVTGVLTFKAIPNATIKSTYSISVAATDGQLVSSLVPVTVNVTDVAPVITSSASITIPEGTSITTPIYTAVANDVAGSTLRYSITGTDASAFNIDAVTGALTFKTVPNATIKSIYNISVAATDGQLVSSLVPVTVNVTDVAPVITSSASITIPEGTSITTPIYTAVASDVVGSTLRYSITGTDASAFNIDAVTGVLTFKAVPNATVKSIYNINVAATDGQLVSSLVPVTVNVTDVAPVITSSASITIPEGTSITTPIYTAVASDVVGSTLRYSITGTDASAFNIDAVTGVLTFKAIPNATIKSTYSISVAATDGQLVSSLVPVTVNVTDVAPVITSSASITIPEGTSITTPIYTAVASDVPNTALSYTLVGPDASSFNLNPQTGVLTFKHAPDASVQTVYTVNVIVSDGIKTSFSPITINLMPVNNPTRDAQPGNVSSVTVESVNDVSFFANQNSSNYSNGMIDGKVSDASSNKEFSAGYISQPITSLLNKYDHIPSWGWAHSPDFVNLTPIVEGLSQVLTNLNELNIQNIDKTSAVLNDKVFSSNTIKVAVNQSYSSVTNGMNRPDVLKDKITVALNTDNSAKIVVGNKIDAILAPANLQARNATFKERVRALLKDFGIDDA